MSSIEYILSLLPVGIRRAVEDHVRKKGIGFDDISDIRMVLKRRMSLSVGGKSYPIGYIATEDELSFVFLSLCRNGVYKYESSIKEGYIPLLYGCRAAVYGEASECDGKVETLREKRGIILRVSKEIYGKSDVVCRLFFEERKGILIYSPPAFGKTTCLRDIAVTLSRGISPLRVALIDSRGELDNGALPSECLIDTLSSYPKAKGIEIATRTLSPDVIITDEIGDKTESDAILSAISAGVPFIASAHARKAEELYRRPAIAGLLRSGAFSYICSLNRNGDSFAFKLINIG